MLRNTLLATALSGALALSPAASTPAYAAPDTEDIILTILGLAAIGALAGAFDNDNDRPATRRGGSNRVRLQPLPSSCAFEARTDRGWAEVLGARCMRRAGVDLDRLPRNCVTDIRTEQGWRTAYGASCLQRAGYRFEASRRHRHD